LNKILNSRADGQPPEMFANLSPNMRGALWILAGVAFFSVMTVFFKLLGPVLGVSVVAFFRTALGFLFILPFAMRFGFGGLASNRKKLHFFRSLLGVSAIFCGVYSFSNLAMADVVALSFTRPLFLIVLAVIFLGEQVRVRRWTATFVGFLGVLVMVRPSGELEPAAGVALLGALLVAGSFVCTKKLSSTERPALMLFYMNAIAAVIATVPAYLYWQTPTWQQLAMLIVMGATAIAGQTCVVRGLRVGEATAVSPFTNSRILLAAAIGYFMFDEIPDIWTWVGAGIIVSVSIYIAHREQSRRAQAATS